MQLNVTFEKSLEGTDFQVLENHEIIITVKSAVKNEDVKIFYFDFLPVDFFSFSNPSLFYVVINKYGDKYLYVEAEGDYDEIPIKEVKQANIAHWL